MENANEDQTSQTDVFRRIDARAKKKWRLSRLIALIIILALSIAGYFFLWHRITEDMPAEIVQIVSLTAGLVAGGLLLLQLLNLIIYPEIEYRQWSYCLTADRIEIKKGIIFHSTTIIPITRIQHVTVSEGPFARLYGLAKVDITTAGSTNDIDGLAVETARELCDRMKNAVNTKVLDKRLRQSSNNDTPDKESMEDSDSEDKS